MAEPFSPAHAELLLGGVWTDVIADTRDAGADDGQIAITRARPDEAGVARPTVVRLGLNDLDSTYEWRNPASTCWGQLRRGTPLRVYRGVAHLGDDNSDATDTFDHVAPGLTVPADPGEGMLISAWMAPDAVATYTVPGVMTAVAAVADTRITMQTAKQLIASAGATGTRTAACSTLEDYAAVSVWINGPTADPTGAVSASDGDVAVDGTAGDWWVVIAGFNSDPAVDADVVLRPPAAPLDSDGGGWILLADTGSVLIGDTQAQHLRMKAWVKQVRTTNAAHRIELPATSTVDEQLMTVKRIPGANVSLWDIRAHVRISALPHRRDLSGNARWVPVEGVGVLRAVDRRRAPSRSTIYRAARSEDQAAWLVAYWPCEDAPGATSLGSAVSGVHPMEIDGNVTAAGYDGFAGSEPVATLSENRAKANGQVPPYPTGSTFYRGLFAVPPAGLGTGAGLVNLYCTGTARRYKVQWSSASGGSLQLRSFDGDGALLSESGVIAFGVTGTQFLLSVELVQDGTGVDWLLFVRKTAGNQVDVGNVQTGTFATQTVGRVRRIQIGGGSNDGLSFGHQIIGTSQQLLFNIRDALVGYAGETAANRVVRLSLEAGIACAIVGDRDDDVAMGPERAGQTLAANLRECATTGGGLLFEPRQFYGITYRTVRSLYGQETAALALTFGARGEVMPPLEPVPDDALVVNDVTVSGTGGGTAQAVQRTGPLNVQDPGDDNDGVGTLDGSATVNVASSVDLPNHAHWRLHAGTLAQDRFPEVTLNLAALDAAGKGGLLEDAAALDAGDRLTIGSLPDSYGPDDISQLAVGFAELISKRMWEISLNNVPEVTYGRVLRYTSALETPAADDAVRYGANDTTRNVTTTSTQTSMDVSVNDRVPWIYDAGLNLDAVAGNYASTPDTGVLDITGDIDVRVDLTAVDWTPTAAQYLLSKFMTTGNQRSWRLFLQTSGVISFGWSVDGTADLVRTSTVAPTIANGQRLAVRATLDVNNGAAGHTVAFYTAPTIDGPWTALGSPVVTAGVTSIFSGTAPVEAGAVAGGTQPLAGSLHAAEVRNGIDGTVVAGPNFATQSGDSFVDDAGLTWTVHGIGLVTPQYDILMGGERMTVTAVVTNAANSQTFSVVRSVNGVVKAHPANVKVQLWHEAVWGL